MNVGLIIGRFPPDVIGGAELQAQQIAAKLTQRGHRVTVFTRRYHGRPYIEQKDGYQICRRNELPLAGLRMVWDIFPVVWQLAIHQPHYDVLLCYQTLNSGMIGFAAQKLLGVPMILSVRGNREYRFKNSMIQHLVIPPIFRHAKCVIVQSTYILKDMLQQFQLSGESELAECIQAKTVVIPNGIGLESFKRSKGSKVIYVGRLIKNKGVADLITAMKELPAYELLIVGDGPDRQRLESLAQGMSATFTGQIRPSMVASYLEQARVLVLPSYLGDGLPNVILEAMACGVPVVATRTAGIPDLVKHTETGYLFDVGDIKQMTIYIDRLMKDDRIWEDLGVRSYEAIKAFSWDTITPQVEQILYEVISKNKSPNG